LLPRGSGRWRHGAGRSSGGLRRCDGLRRREGLRCGLRVDRGGGRLNRWRLGVQRGDRFWRRLFGLRLLGALLRETMKNAATRPAAAIDPPMTMPIV